MSQHPFRWGSIASLCSVNYERAVSDTDRANVKLVALLYEAVDSSVLSRPMDARTQRILTPHGMA